MRNIQECFSNSQPLATYVQCALDPQEVNEGLRELMNIAKDKLGKAAHKMVEFSKSVVAAIGDYDWYMPIDESGELLPCSTVLTMGAAYMNGSIDKNSTFVALSKNAGRVIGFNQPFSNALKLPVYKIKANQYWNSINESFEPSNEYMINEVKMANEDPEAVYNVIDDDEDLKSEIKYHMHEKMARLMIWGAPGIGKTAILMNVIDEISAEQGKDYNLIVKTLSNETPDNFMLPKYVGDRADDVPKTWLPVWRPTGDSEVDAELDEKCGRGLLFLDELSRATQQVQNVILPLVNEGIFNGWKLGSGWFIVCASNREEDEEGNAQTRIGNALGNRFAQVYYEPTCKTWRNWADKQGFMSPLLTQWLSMPQGETLAGGKFFYWDPNEEGDGDQVTHLMCTPRSWTNAMRDLALRHHTGSLEGFNIFDLDEKWIKRVLNKYVPAKAVESFWAFLRTIQAIGNFDEAVESAWRGDGKGLKIAPKDLIKVSMPLAQLVCCAHKDSLPTAREFESFANWLVAANNEQLASYALDVFANVFAKNVPDTDSSLKLTNLKQYIFLLKKMVDSKPDVWKNIHVFDAFLKAWGITYDTMPDYSKGHSIIAKKYANAFKTAVVDGVDALG